MCVYISFQATSHNHLIASPSPSSPSCGIPCVPWPVPSTAPPSPAEASASGHPASAGRAGHRGSLKGNSIGLEKEEWTSKGKLGRPNEKPRKTKEQPRKTPGKHQGKPRFTDSTKYNIHHRTIKWANWSSTSIIKIWKKGPLSRRGYQPKKQTNKKKEEWSSNETKCNQKENRQV